MEKSSGPPTSVTDTNTAPPAYPGPPPQGSLPDGYYSSSGPPPSYPATAQPYQNQPYQNQPYQNQPYQNQPYQNQPYPVQQGYPTGYPATQEQIIYPGQTTQNVVVQQPNMIVVQPGGVVPPDYQALAWFACLCCCWPLGLVAIIKSNEVRNAAARGDYLTANAASQSARTMSYLSIGLGIAFMVMYILILVIYLIPLLAMSSNHY